MAKVMRQRQKNWPGFLVFAVIFALFCAGAHAAQVGPQNPSGNATTDGTILGCSNTSQWGNLGNPNLSDDQYTSLTHPSYDTLQISHALKVTGFDFSAVPSNATITGIGLELERYASAGGAVDYELRLTKSGSYVGDNKALAPAWASRTSSN